MRSASQIPTESQEQEALFRWANLQKAKYPELALLVHIPNGVYRNKAEAAHLKAQGVSAGFPDLVLPVARGGCHSLYIELKRSKNGRVTPEQAAWLECLAREGHCAAVCRGWLEAKDVIERYLREEMQK